MAENVDRIWQVALLALTLWREARSETKACRVAIAGSVMNRVKRPSWWGRTVDQVLVKTWQYSSLTAPDDKQLTRWPKLDPLFAECLAIAASAVDGTLQDLMPGADSYHDTTIRPPAWTIKARCCGQIDSIVFYDVDHDYEQDAVPLAKLEGRA